MIERTLRPILQYTAEHFPVVFLTGPRQSGKTTLAKAAFRSFQYLSLEDLQSREEATEDPRGFLRRFEMKGGVILDEAQRAPDLFSYLQGFVDEGRGGPFVLTGSQQFTLFEKIAQSLAGRAAILDLLPLSLAELQGRPAMPPDGLGDLSGVAGEPPSHSLEDLMFSGFYPRIHDRGIAPATWLDGYIRTYVERDVRMVSQVGDLDTFSRFLALCAGRAGQLLNASSLASDAGISHVTAKRWLSVLRAGYILDFLLPHHQNFSKRLVKAPKLYFTDTGLLCHLLGIRKREDLRAHPLRGAIFENFVIAELRKVYLHHGQKPPLYFWRDSNGREVDVIADMGASRLPIEVKAGETVSADALRGLDAYIRLSGDEGGLLFHGGGESYMRKGHQIRPWWTCS